MARESESESESDSKVRGKRNKSHRRRESESKLRAESEDVKLRHSEHTGRIVGVFHKCVRAPACPRASCTCVFIKMPRMFPPGPHSLSPPLAVFIQSSSAMENHAVGDGALVGGTCDDKKTATPGCFDYKNWNKGWVGAIAKEIFDEIGSSVVAMTRANFSQESYEVYVKGLNGGSSFTRCVYEIRLGYVDICVSDFWETSQRRKLTPFTSSMLIDNMKLLTMPKGKKGMDTIAGNPALLYSAILAPYKMEVWYCIVLMFIFAGGVIWFLEAGNRENDDYKEDWEGPGKPLGFAKGGNSKKSQVCRDFSVGKKKGH